MREETAYSSLRLRLTARFAYSFIVFLVVSCMLLVVSCYAEVKKFKDMPDKHWASKAVYNLVKLGVTQGFPDGTFRGQNKISRYEVASFLSKLAEVMGGGELKNLKNDLKETRNEIVSLKKESQIPVSGSLDSVLRYGNLIHNDVGGHGPVTNYRLITSMMKELGDGTSVKLNLDTMDAGFYGGVRDVPSQIFDLEGKLKVNPEMEVVLSVGPGPLQHTDATNILPGEKGVVYDRPYTGIAVNTKLQDFKVGGSYAAVKHAATGVVNTNRVSGIVAYTFPQNSFEVSAVGDYYVKSPLSAGEKDLRTVIGLSVPFAQKIRLSTQLGVGKSQNSGMMVGGSIHLDDLWNTGTTISLSGSKVGSQYITFPDEEFNYAGLDYFNRPLENATVNIGGELIQALTKQLALKGKGALRLSPDFGYGKTKDKSRATAQVGLTYNIAPQTIFDAFYRIEQDPTISQTSDITGVGLLYRF